MNPVENHGDWMKGISGSRRRTSETTRVVPTSIDVKTSTPQSVERNIALPGANDSSFVPNAMQAAKWNRARFDCHWNKRPSGDRLTLLAISQMGPINWVEAVRGFLFFGIVATTVCLEWTAIKSLATYFASCF
jgi:hypothetical protein